MPLNKYIFVIGFFLFGALNNALTAQSDSLKAKSETGTKPTEKILEPKIESKLESPPSTGLTIPPIVTPYETPVRRQRKKIIDSSKLIITPVPVLTLASVDSATVNQTKSSNSPKDSTPVLSQSNNPFDILRGSVTETKPTVQATQSITDSQFLEKKTYSRNFNFWIFFFNFLLISVLISYGRKSVWASYNSLLSENILKQSFREFNSKSFVRFTIDGLYLIFILNLSVFIFLYLKSKNLPFSFGQGALFLYCLATVGIVFAIKHFLLFTISNIFPIEKEILLYNFIILITGILTGLTLFALNLFLAFSPSTTTGFIVNLGVILMVVMYVARYLRSLSIVGKFLTENRFHFLLYICSVEIAPVVICVKLLLIYNFGI